MNFCFRHNFFKYLWEKPYRLYQGWRGQKQTLFILEFKGHDKDIKLDKTENVGFKWVTADALLSSVHPVRLELAKKVKIELLKIMAILLNG